MTNKLSQQVALFFFKLHLFCSGKIWGFATPNAPPTNKKLFFPAHNHSFSCTHVVTHTNVTVEKKGGDLGHVLFQHMKVHIKLL